MECLILEIRSEPYEMNGKWHRDVKYTSWGAFGFTRIEFTSKKLALACRPKHKFRKDENHKITML